MSCEAKAYFALACFWKPDAQFGACSGVLRTKVGYCGGNDPPPNYPSVGDHTEAIEIEYDPDVLNYKDLLCLFWKFHDPCSCQKRQYKSAVYYTSEVQRISAEESKEQYEIDYQKTVTTEILPLNVFHQAEDYHQKYFLRTYHRHFYLGLPPQDPVTSTRDARLNGYLSGYGTLEDLNREKRNLDLTEEQLEYLRKHMSKELKPSSIEPFIRTIIQVIWNYLKTLIGF